MRYVYPLSQGWRGAAADCYGKAPIAYSDDPAPEEFVVETITMTLDGAELTFEAIAQEEIDAQARAMEDAPNLLAGTWSSMYYRSFNTNPASDTLALDYTVTFSSDGTFTASVGDELSGTWVYNNSRGDETNGRHSFSLYFQGDLHPYDVELEYTESHVPQLSIESRSTVPGSRRMLFLNKRSPQQDQMARSLIGSWTSMYVITGSGEERERVNTIDYSFIFHENGTFTGNDGTELEGTWLYERTTDDTAHQYSLFLNGQTQRYASISLYDHSEYGDETTIEYRIYSEETGSRNIRLISYTPEELDAALLGPTHILGEWASPTGDYSITFQEDGSFTANVGDTIQGTWSFYRYKPGAAYWYSFAYPNQNEYSDHTLYAHTDDDRLTFRIAIGDTEEFYEMYRSE